MARRQRRRRWNRDLFGVLRRCHRYSTCGSCPATLTRDLINRPQEFLGNLTPLIVGGNETTRNSISGGVWALNHNPGEYSKLRDNPGLIPSLVPEIIRWQTPVMHMRRTAAADGEIGGKAIRKGDKVVMWYISGNRDEDAIPRAN